MCKVWNQAGKKAAAGADICDLDVKQTVTDRRDVCTFAPSSGKGNKVERRRASDRFIQQC